MSMNPKNTFEKGTLHTLIGINGERKVFEWTGAMWSTPNTGYGSSPSIMTVLGWRYGEPYTKT